MNIRSHLEEIQNNNMQAKQWYEAQKTAFELTGDNKIFDKKQDPRDFNVLWRSYVKNLYKCGNDNTNTGRPDSSKYTHDTDCDNDDELADLLELSVDERIFKLNMFLRTQFYYCLFCHKKYSSEPELFENCPGPKAQDHY